MLAALRWVAFLWGCLATSVMAYYAAYWFPHAQDIRHNEMAVGFMFGALYGWPAWLALPAFVVALRKSLPRWQVVALLAPVTVAVLLYITGRMLAAGVF